MILGMRLLPGVTIDHADTVLTDASTAWTNAQGGSFGYFAAYVGAVDRTYTQLRACFAEPDLAGAIHSDAFWHLLPAGPLPTRGPTQCFSAHTTRPTGESSAR
jgi:hypothetical protein